MPELISEASLKKLLVSVSIIFLFIALKTGPLGVWITPESWYWWAIGAFIVFAFAQKITRKIKETNVI